MQYGFPISRYEFAWIGSAISLGCLLVSPFYGWSVKTFGRKRMLMIFWLPSALGYIVTSFAQNVTTMVLGRILSGMGVGGYTVAVPLYTAEIAETHIRGKLGVFFQFMIVSGVLFSYIIGSLLSVFSLSIICSSIPVLHALLVMFIPESPIYYLEQNKEKEARKSLQWFRGGDYNIDEEFSVKKKYIEEIKAAQLPLCEAFSTRAAKRGLVICLGLMAIRHFCGATGIIFYNTTIFEEAGSTLSPNLQTILLGTVDIVFTFVSSTVVDKLGRRPLLFASTAGMAVCTFFIGLFFVLKDRNYDVHSLSWIPLVFLCLFFIAFSLGIGPLPTVFFGETFPRNIATHAASICTCFAAACIFITTHYFEVISLAIGRGELFFIFSACSFLGVIFIYCLVIETKNKPLEQIIHELED